MIVVVSQKLGVWQEEGIEVILITAASAPHSGLERNLKAPEVTNIDERSFRCRKEAAIEVQSFVKT